MKAIVPAWRANSLSNNWFNEFDHLFDSLIDSRVSARPQFSYDLKDNEENFLFSLDLPGVDEKDITIELKDGVLSISGERESYGRIRKSFSLPKSVDQEKIEAECTNGVLRVLLPKKEAAQPRKIELKTKKGGLF